MVARNRLNRMYRTSKRKGIEIISDSSETKKIIIKNEQENKRELEIKENQLNLIKEAMNQLEDPCKKLLELFYIRGLSTKEIAEELGYTAPFVKVKKYRCMQKIRDLIKNFEDSEHLKSE